MSIREGAFGRLEPLLSGIADRAVEVDKTASFPGATVVALKESGLLGLVTPTSNGGLGGGFTDAAAVVERVAQRCASTAMVLCMHYAGAAVIAAHGTPEFNQEVAEGRALLTLAFSEVGSRSHFWAPESSAVAGGGGVRLNARKSWVTSAHHATHFVWSSKPVKADGVSTLWLVKQGAVGLSVPRPFDGLGLRGNDSSPIDGNDVVVESSARLGGDGQGFDIMMGVVLPIFQIMCAGTSLGISEAALSGACAHASGTSFTHLGAALSSLPTVRAYLAKARVQTDMARSLWLDTLSAVETGRPDAMLRVLECKAAAGETAQEVTSTCMRVCGGAAFRKEVGVERAFRDATAAGVMAPTSDVLYDFIGKAITGLPLFG